MLGRGGYDSATRTPLDGGVNLSCWWWVGRGCLYQHHISIYVNYMIIIW